MAIVVIFGLVVATFLTLVVVPVLYSLLATMSELIGSMVASIRKLYWKPIERIT
jgi:multidrug efflux pump